MKMTARWSAGWMTDWLRGAWKWRYPATPLLLLALFLGDDVIAGRIKGEGSCGASWSEQPDLLFITQKHWKQQLITAAGTILRPGGVVLQVESKNK